MKAKRKVTYTFYTDGTDSNRIDTLAVARRIRMAALAAGETMAGWARELGVSRQFVYQVVNGTRKSQRVRDFIQARLKEIFWPGKPQTEEPDQRN
jgi:hypothetical protein